MTLVLKQYTIIQRVTYSTIFSSKVYRLNGNLSHHNLLFFNKFRMGAIPGDVPFKDDDAELASWNLTDVDRMLLKQTDEEYIPHDWEELKGIIGTSDSS